MPHCAAISLANLCRIQNDPHCVCSSSTVQSCSTSARRGGPPRRVAPAPCVTASYFSYITLTPCQVQAPSMSHCFAQLCLLLEYMVGLYPCLMRALHSGELPHAQRWSPTLYSSYNVVWAQASSRSQDAMFTRHLCAITSCMTIDPKSALHRAAAAARAAAVFGATLKPIECFVL